MEKRVIVLFSILMFGISAMIVNIYSLSQGQWLCEAASQQSSYKLNVAKLRGTVYDCRKVALTGNEKINIAAVIPDTDTITAISEKLTDKERKNCFKLMKTGKPFLLKLNKRTVSSSNIDIFKIPQRYSALQLAPHIVGYLNRDGHGVSGIEKAYDDYLSNTGANISVKYKVDAVNRVIGGDKRIIDDKSYLQTRGVVLTIDSRLQKIAQDAAKNYINTGAVVITEVPNCEIRAAVSLPGFYPENVAACLRSENSPFLNRVLSQYDVGSTFKLVTAAAALEAGISEKTDYECKGSTKVEDRVFHCFDGNVHKHVDMNHAIAYSCNTYFIDISNKLDAKKLLDMSKAFGLGSPCKLADGMTSAAGVLPSEESLSNKKILSNFSFGQGRLMATPLQIAGLINTIASNGEYRAPKLVEGLVNENLKYVSKTENQKAVRVISKDTAAKLRSFMLSSIDYGTSKKGKPSNLKAGAKTATAETGIQINGERVVQAWYAGFYPYDKPKYCIVVLAENGVGGGESCGPTFKKIMDDIYNRIPGALI